MHGQLDIMTRMSYQLQNYLRHQGQGIIKLSKRIKIWSKNFSQVPTD